MSEQTFSPETHTLVLGIDYGTSRSGFAYTIIPNEQLDKPIKPGTRIEECFQWPGRNETQGKTATALFYPPGTMEPQSWGKQAIEDYLDAEDGHLEQETKMRLKAPWQEVNGFRIPTVKVVSDYLRYLFKHFEGRFNETSTFSVRDYQAAESFRVAMTIPKVWGENDKLVMREAFLNAGILVGEQAGRNLVLVFEPEAGLLDVLYGYYTDGNIPTNEVFICVDAGGGTVDITVLNAHLENGNYLFSQPVSGAGNRFGSTSLDERYIKLLTKKFNAAVPDSVELNLVDRVELVQSWILEKHTLSDLRPRTVSILDWIGRQHENLGFVNLHKRKGYLLELDSDDMTYVYEESMGDIHRLVGKIVYNLMLTGYDTSNISIATVGGFGQSEVIKARLTDVISEMKLNKEVKSVNNCEAAVVRGAVLYGINPSSINQRISDFNYGLSVTELYDPKRHDAERIKVIKGKELVTECYHPLTTEGEVLKIDQKISYSFYTLNEYQHSMTFNFLKSPTDNVVYADEAETILKLTCNFSNPGNGRKMRIDVYPGNTELFIDIVDEETGTSTRGRLDGTIQEIEERESHLIFVLDVSKSMEKDDIVPDNIDRYPPNRMGAVIEAFYTTIESMKGINSLKDSIVSLVTLSGVSRTILRRIHVNEVPEFEELAIEHHRGTRYLYALEKIRKSILEEDEQKPVIVFLSDGNDAGEDFTDVLNEMITAYPTIVIHSVSFGRNKNAGKLEQMSAAAKGFFFNCKSSTQLIEAFETVQCINYNFGVIEEQNNSSQKIKRRKEKTDSPEGEPRKKEKTNSPQEGEPRKKKKLDITEQPKKKKQEKPLNDSITVTNSSKKKKRKSKRNN